MAAGVTGKGVRTVRPSLAVERELWEQGNRMIAGVDEVGRGAWAGPISVGVAILPTDRRVYKVRDSKMLTEHEREQLFARVSSWCVAWSVGHASAKECDELGMSEAQRLAARRAFDTLDAKPDVVLIDGRWDFVGAKNTRLIVKGDASCLSIAAASVLAKVTRDRLMRAEAEHFPGYDFDLNKGYPCPRHKMSLRARGPTSIHRRTWAFMEAVPWGGQLSPRGQLRLALAQARGNGLGGELSEQAFEVTGPEGM